MEKDFRSGKLVTLKPTEKRKRGHVVWLCKCDCGNLHEVIAALLKAKQIKSCGCVKRKRFYKHGGKGTALYVAWKKMRQRCNNPNDPKFRRYGARGIKICIEWDDFAAFREWAISAGYREGLTIDRIDNDKNYSPENCQWLTKSEHSKKSHIDYPNSKKWPNGRPKNEKGQFIPL
jgi:hypothetical protein